MGSRFKSGNGTIKFYPNIIRGRLGQPISDGNQPKSQEFPADLAAASSNNSNVENKNNYATNISGSSEILRQNETADSSSKLLKSAAKTEEEINELFAEFDRLQKMLQDMGAEDATEKNIQKLHMDVLNLQKTTAPAAMAHLGQIVGQWDCLSALNDLVPCDRQVEWQEKTNSAEKGSTVFQIWHRRQGEELHKLIILLEATSKNLDDAAKKYFAA